MNPTIALTERETRQVEQAGYAAVTPSWPDDPETVAEARAHPEVLARKTLGQVADHTAEVFGGLEKKPAVMGHSTGGLLAQILADRGLSAATVAIDPGPFRGVLPLPLSTLRGHSLTIDSGWREVAERALAFVKRFAPSTA